MVEDFKINVTLKKRWEITGILATLVIILTVPLYLLKEKHQQTLSSALTQNPAPVFVGREKCVDCHRKEYKNWQGSHHDMAMDVANDKTVLGNFNDAVVEHRGIKSRFFRNGDKFMVHTQGPDGKSTDFEIAYTFGFTPLQQYLVPFPGGRLQCLTIAWDVNKKEWYHLYPDGPTDPTDWLHWTKNGQNWNGMCAECHSTRLQKSYDMKTDTYNTTWSEIDVSCEACHGPGSRHVAWAEVPEMARDQDIDNYGLVVNTTNMDNDKQVLLCARCHARRASLGDFDHMDNAPMDYMIPQLLSERLYFPDGQILDEVYVYGSFVQSKMYKNNVMCNDCHDVHSLNRHKDGNDLCLQCHRSELYDTKDHHFHKKKGEKGEPVKAKDGTVLSKVGEGALCVNCHMPGRYYMGIDFRNDHSLRVPRPDLSVSLKTPNACNQCHQDKTTQWSLEHVTKWYGISRKSHYGTIIDAGTKRLPQIQPDLIRLADDSLSPAIVRSTAISLLRDYPGNDSLNAFKRALMDAEPLVRHTAVHHLSLPDRTEQVKLVAPLLYDPVKSVRIQAAMNLTSLPIDTLSVKQKERFNTSLSEYRKSMEHVGDFSHGRFNLGNMYMNLDQTQMAEENYRAAVKIDALFYPAKVNLAMLYNRNGRNDEAETLFREVVSENPELYEAAYSLGLLLVEQKKFEESVIFLEKAARGMPDHARLHYNLGLLLQQMGRFEEAESALLTALRIEPYTFDFLYAAANHYIKRGHFSKAGKIAEIIVNQFPDNEMGKKMIEFIDRMERR